jgi:hypothetical protein
MRERECWVIRYETGESTLLLAAIVFHMLEQQQELQSLCRLAYPPQLRQGFKAAKGEQRTN